MLHKETCLCNQFMTGVDIFLQSSLDFAYNSLKDDISRAKMDLVLTAISLPPSSFRNFYFPNFVNKHVAKGIQLPISTRASHGYNYSFLGSFITDASRSGIYYRNASHYLQLATNMVPFLISYEILPYLISRSADFSSRKKTPNRNEPGTSEDDEEAQAIIGYAIDAILAIILRFPGDRRFSDILRPNISDLYKIEGGRWASRIKEYLVRINIDDVFVEILTTRFTTDKLYIRRICHFEQYCKATQELYDTTWEVGLSDPERKNDKERKEKKVHTTTRTLDGKGII